MKTLFKTRLNRFFLPVIALMAFISCQKDLSFNGGTIPDPVADLTTRVNSSVSGFVTDENNAAVLGAPVSAGGVTVSTDKYGYFEIKNIQVVKNAAMVVVNQPGYFKGIKTYIAEDGKSAFFRIKLIPKTSAGTIDASTGGNVTLSNGLIIALPAAGVVNAATNAAYTGTVNVAAHFIDPTAADLFQTMPGDLRGLNSAGALKLLTSFGMAAVELTGTSGELLQIASGKKATLTMPIPATIAGNAASSIPLWYFDENVGLWKEDGSATKTGNTYVGEVSHFSFWNCDVPNSYVHFDCTLVNASGGPMPFTVVRITDLATGISGFGFTDNLGYVGGAVPDHANLLMEVYSYYSCGAVIYSRNFSTTNTNVSLGNITINAVASTASVSGTVTDCSNAPVTNGFIIVQQNNWYTRYQLSNTGTFAFDAFLCNGTPTTAILIAEDLNSAQQSTPLNVTFTAGPVPVGNLQACGISIQEFISYSIDGGQLFTMSAPADSISQTSNGSTTMSNIFGTQVVSPSVVHYISFGYDNTGTAVGSVQTLLNFYVSQVGQGTITSSSGVNITEYGAIGQFIAGNFTAVISTGAPPLQTSSNIVCNFRVRRNY